MEQIKTTPYIYLGLPADKKITICAGYRRLITLSILEKIVCEALGCSIDIPRRKTRESESVLARSIFFYFAKKYSGHFSTHPSINALGIYYGKNHSTVLHGEKIVTDRIETERPFRVFCAQVDEMIREQFK